MFLTTIIIVLSSATSFYIRIQNYPTNKFSVKCDYHKTWLNYQTPLPSLIKIFFLAFLRNILLILLLFISMQFSLIQKKCFLRNYVFCCTVFRFCQPFKWDENGRDDNWWRMIMMQMKGRKAIARWVVLNFTLFLSHVKSVNMWANFRQQNTEENYFSINRVKHFS